MTSKEVSRVKTAEMIRAASKQQRGEPDLRATHIRNIPGEVYKELRIEAARQEISINELLVNVLTKEAKRIEKRNKREGVI